MGNLEITKFDSKKSTPRGVKQCTKPISKALMLDYFL